MKKKNYSDYLASQHWNRRKWAFYLKQPRKCAACLSDKNVIVRHLSYKKLGNEPDSDLALLCKECHNEFHAKYGSQRFDLREKTIEFISERRELVEAETLLAWI